MQARISNDGKKFPLNDHFSCESNQIIVQLSEVPGSNHNWVQLVLFDATGSFGRDWSWSGFTTEWIPTDKEKIPDAKRLANYARVKSSARPNVTLRFEFRRALCWKCYAPVAITMWEDDPNDSEDDHKDGIILLNKTSVKVDVGGTLAPIDATAKVISFEVLHGNP